MKRATTSTPLPVSAPVAAVPRPYLSADQLTELTPWSKDALDKMVSRGTLRRGVHYFQIGGERKKDRIYKWSAIEALIEGRPIPDQSAEAKPVDQPAETMAKPPARKIDVEKATRNLQAMLN